MLPSNPRSRGLPTNPRSAGPGGRPQRMDRGSNDTHDYSAASSHSSRSQRPTTPSRNRGGHSQPASRRSNDSSSSSSSASSGGSFLDRMKNGSSGYASSVTTVEDDYKDDKRKANNRGRDDEDNYQDEQPAQTGEGWTIWSRVANAAGSLTVNVSKAWATNIATYAGEETPPGQESRLTRAMKAYHLEKARDPADLPAWLFDEHERRARRATTQEREDKVMETRQTKQSSSSPPKGTPPRGLRDVYDAVSMPAKANQINSNSTDSAGVNRAAPRKGTDRLRAMREAKRAQGSDTNTYGAPEPEEEAQRSRGTSQAPRGRVGLPGGPARNRRG